MFRNPSRQQNRYVQVQIIAAVPNCQKFVVGGYLNADSFETKNIRPYFQKTGSNVCKILLFIPFVSCCRFPVAIIIFLYS
jgi:hypothetical protein